MMWDLAACRADRDDIRQLVAVLSERFGRDLDVLDVFFPPSNHHPDEQVLNGVAKNVCHSCPLLVECGEWAARNGQWDGIHGGLHKDAKKALAKKLGVPRHGTLTGYTGDGCRCQECRDAITDYDRQKRPRKRPCGTYAAARRHMREGSVMCGPCREAYEQYRREEAWRRKVA